MFNLGMANVKEHMNETQVAEVVLDSLKKVHEPREPRQLIDDVLKASNELDEWSVRKAIWRLTADSKAEFTPDRKLKPLV